VWGGFDFLDPIGKIEGGLLQGLKYESRTNKNYGILDETQGTSDSFMDRAKCLDCRCMDLLLPLLSKYPESRCTCPDGLVACQYRYWNGRAVGAALQFFIRRHEREKARARLVPTLMRKRLVTIEVKLTDGQTRKSESAFWYLRLTNTGEEDANEVTPLVNVSGEFAGIMQISIIGVHYKDEITVKSKLTSEAFDPRRGRFARALVADAEAAKPSLRVDGLASSAFLLCFAMKYENQLSIPFDSPIVLDFPVHVVLTVYWKAHGLPRRYLGSYTCHGSNWSDCTVEPVLR
jgi:hypothetical protein